MIKTAYLPDGEEMTGAGRPEKGLPVRRIAGKTCAPVRRNVSKPAGCQSRLADQDQQSEAQRKCCRPTNEPTKSNATASIAQAKIR